jgi:hypothetical protein
MGSPTMTRNPLAMIVFTAGAVLSAVWAFYNLRPLSDLFGFTDFGGGGMVAVNTGIDVLLSIGTPLVAFLISRRVRERTGFARTLRRAHVVTTATIVALVALFIGLTVLADAARQVDRLSFALVAGAFTGAALWLPLQSFFAIGFVGLLINERGRTA